MTTRNGNVAMITGAAGALGQSTAETFLKADYRLVLIDREIERLQQKWNGRDGVLCLQCDLTDTESIDTAVVTALDSYGSIDVLLTIAGGFAMGPPVHELTEDDWNSMQDMNVRTVFLTCRSVIPHMRRQRRGSIATIGARTALHATAKLAPYIISKSSVIRLTECLAAENTDCGLRANCVLPGVIDTPANRRDMPDADTSGWTSPEKIADVLLFLASDASAAVNGASIPV
ncbi:MAG: SDR family NAD(P)-dependent oxidoreductase [Prosthecochloris sp.]|nr:SDR family NAD(P)-dependent oxidoreductase [Prosthecochloris sp.]